MIVPRVEICNEEGLSENSGNESNHSDYSSNTENDNDVALSEGNPGWANALAQVLKSTKPKTKKTLILSRSRKIQKSKVSKKTYDFEIENEDEKPDIKILQQNLSKKDSKNKVLDLRVRPSLTDREREKNLKKIATKGVVQLFNAVRMQQKEIERQLEEAGPLDHRRDEVLNNINKKKFLDVLMGGKRSQSEHVDNPVKIEKPKSETDESEYEEVDQAKQWSVLRDDFMTGKKTTNDDTDSDENMNDSNNESFDEE